MDNYKMLELATYNAEGRASLLANDEGILCEEVGNFGVNCDAPGGIPFAFNGRWRSKVTGFVNMTHRWYSPRMGEFISHDPMGFIDSYNLFGFATYDPINGYDPFGLQRSFFEKATTAVAGFSLGVGIGIVPGGWAVTIIHGDQFARMSPELRESIGVGMMFGSLR